MIIYILRIVNIANVIFIDILCASVVLLLSTIHDINIISNALFHNKNSVTVFQLRAEISGSHSKILYVFWLIHAAMQIVEMGPIRLFLSSNARHFV